MVTYRIKSRTNGYIASRDAAFSGKTEVTITNGLTMKEARKKLLQMFNRTFGTSYTNWGIAVRMTIDDVFGARPTFSDGTRAFDYDGRTYSIEKEEL